MKKKIRLLLFILFSFLLLQAFSQTPSCPGAFINDVFEEATDGTLINKELHDWYIGLSKEKGQDAIRAWHKGNLAENIDNWDDLLSTNYVTVSNLYNDVLNNAVNKGNGNIALGFANQLQEFSVGTGSIKYTEWKFVFNTNPNVGNLNIFKDVFPQVLNASISAGNKINFKLDGIIDNPNFISIVNNGDPELINSFPFVTLWELSNIVKNSNYFTNTIFFHNGNVVELSQLLQSGITPAF